MRSTRSPGDRLTDEVFEDLLRRGAEAWDRLTERRNGRYANLVPADPRGARDWLRRLRARGRTFLELGSGVGVITIVADLLSYDACGIEIEPALVDESMRLAERYGSNAVFAEGSFVPPESREDVHLMSAAFLTVTEGADAYDELGRNMADFDIVYAYPWPDEQEWMLELVRRHARPDAALLTYSGRDGYELTEMRR